MADDELQKRINTLNIELLNTVASLGEFVVAQNAALIELARLVSEDRKGRGDLASLQTLSVTLDAVKEQSHGYVKTLRASVTSLQKVMGEDSDA